MINWIKFAEGGQFCLYFSILQSKCRSCFNVLISKIILILCEQNVKEYNFFVKTAKK